ncbi:unnamed protein product [Camellia sinensis]
MEMEKREDQGFFLPGQEGCLVQVPIRQKDPKDSLVQAPIWPLLLHHEEKLSSPPQPKHHYYYILVFFLLLLALQTAESGAIASHCWYGSIWNGNQQTRWALIRIDSRSSVQSLAKSIPKVQFKPRDQVSKDDALKMYSSMVTLQTMDNIFYEAQRQGRMSFYLTSYGEDAINIASAAALTQDDIILPQLMRLDLNFKASVIHLQLS